MRSIGRPPLDYKSEVEATRESWGIRGGPGAKSALKQGQRRCCGTSGFVLPLNGGLEMTGTGRALGEGNDVDRSKENGTIK